MFGSKESIRKELAHRIRTTYAKPFREATNNEIYQCLSRMIMQEIGERYADGLDLRKGLHKRRVYYFSMEYLLGKMMTLHLQNLGLKTLVIDALDDMGLDYEVIRESEMEAGLGNGGLGRLAACYIDSMASLGISACGCGIGYRHGLFRQKIVEGEQIELPDQWLKESFPWDIRHLDDAVDVNFYGQVGVDYREGKLHFRHYDYQTVRAIPYYMPIVGTVSGQINMLKLWSADLPEEDMDYSQFGNMHLRTQIREKQWQVEQITEFLYPDDSQIEGRILRLKQQYFLSSAGVQSIIRDFKKEELPFSELPKHAAIHINDTHPVLVIPELMRVLMDQENLDWDDAWAITLKTVSYTNHTIMPEALETWPLDMMRNLLPRITMIIEEMNIRTNQACQEKGYCDPNVLQRLGVVQNGMVHMANLAVAYSYSVNGVAALHTDLLKTKVMADFYQVYPDKFKNVTNGINHRRWVSCANPTLCRLITDSIGEEWKNEASHLVDLLPYTEDSAFKESFRKVKQDNKQKLTDYILDTMDIKVDPESIFDVQIKRLHGYKRQLMNILHIVNLYLELKDNPNLDVHPRTFLFGAKAAPSYYFAKDVIKLINTVAETINNDTEINDLLKVVFLEDYRVSLAERIIPAVDVSEQISTASKEASGTGNMKMMMNGALTIGTLDGANVEIKDAVGEENIFLFGLTADEVMAYYQNGSYSAMEAMICNPVLQRVLAALDQGAFHKAQSAIHNIKNSLLLENDQYFVLKDFASYQEAQKRVKACYRDQDLWTRKAIINVAKSGYFTGDRAIREYAKNIWNIKLRG